MKATAAILALLLVAGTAMAQEQETTPDYSRSTLMRLFVTETLADDGRRIVYRPGVVNFVALGTSWQFDYLPQAFLPLSGTDTGVTQTWPDPFSLTGTQIATSPRAWRTRRQLSQELERINATERAKVRVNVR
ncbi:MAG TPA: hypothetical protein VEK57_14095 [Thermoanaerobaculia bacterium]|nr:hypothetical protein [Thermoanaerobaculia bacterium]